ncbi:MAG: hypothetical protein ABL958_04860 [Bdellovibrionia bacterium]
MVVFVLLGLVSAANANMMPIPQIDFKLNLIGTVIRDEGSFATISKEKPDSRANYKVDERPVVQVKIVKIEREKVTLIVYPRKATYVLRTPPYDPSKAVKSGFIKTAEPGKDHEFNLARKEVDKLLENFASIIMDAGSEPVKEGEKVVGFKLTFINSGSVFEKLGLSEGDIIREVNGRKIDSIQAGLDLFYQLRDSSIIKVRLDRSGKTSNITYLIR